MQNKPENIDKSHALVPMLLLHDLWLVKWVTPRIHWIKAFSFLEVEKSHTKLFSFYRWEWFTREKQIYRTYYNVIIARCHTNRAIDMYIEGNWFLS